MRTIKKIFFTIIVISFTIFLAETCVRIYWEDAPENYLSVYKYFVKFLADNNRLQYDHLPNWRGEETGVIVSTNEAGLRDVSEEEYKKKKLIIFSGDSMFFGFGVNQNSTITNQLNNKFAKFKDFHNVNNGVCGYNIIQSFEKTKELLERYPGQVKYVFFSFIHNDIEGLFKTLNQSDTEIYPEVSSSFFTEPDKKNFTSRLLNLIMPDDMLSLRFGKAISLRKILLRYSRLYLFIALNLKKIVYANSAGEFPQKYINPELKISDILIYKPLEQTLLEIKDYMEKKKIRYSIVVLTDHIIKGLPIEKIETFASSNHIPLYNLSPFLPEIREYARDYTLGWDAHPNSAGTLLFAKLLKQILDYESVYQEEKSDFRERYSAARNIYDNDNKIYREEQMDKFVESVYITGNNIDFKNAYIRDRHIIFGDWEVFPFVNKKVNIRVDGIWTSKYFSVCCSSEIPLKTIRLHFNDYKFESASTKIFINGIEAQYSIKQSAGKGFIEFQCDRTWAKNIKNLNFYELLFIFGDTFNDSNNRVFGPFITRMEILEQYSVK